MQGQAADGGHHLRAVDERQSFLRSELEGLEVRPLERIGPGHPFAVEDRFTFADEHERGVGEGREIA